MADRTEERLDEYGCVVRVSLVDDQGNTMHTHVEDRHVPQLVKVHSDQYGTWDETNCMVCGKRMLNDTVLGD